MALSVIVPVFNNPRDIAACVAALKQAAVPGMEILVVDDASTDATPAAVAAMDVQLLRLVNNSGPAAARNFGARQARGDLLFFVDADVVLAKESLRQVEEIFGQRPDISAVFGSYDAQPSAPGMVSQYRNLLHHYVHQNGNTEAATFWAGCGAIRRSIFEQMGGFDDKRFPQPSIEDIELGYRLRAAGHAILLDKSLQGKHLKQWSLSSLLRTDILNRALPWSRLILETRNLPNDLNLSAAQRGSVLLVGLSSVFLLVALLDRRALIVSALVLLALLVLNRKLYGFFLRQRGLRFAAVSVALHLTYYLYSGASFGWAWCEFHWRRWFVRSLGPKAH